MGRESPKGQDRETHVQHLRALPHSHSAFQMCISVTTSSFVSHLLVLRPLDPRRATSTPTQTYTHAHTHPLVKL